MGGQCELRRHKPERHVAPIRPVLQPARVVGRNSDANTNCKSNRDGYRHLDSNGDGDSDCYSHSNANFDSNGYSYRDSHSDVHAYTGSNSYSYANPNFDTKTYAHAEA